MESWKVVMVLVAIMTAVGVILWGLNIYSNYIYIRETSAVQTEAPREAGGVWALLEELPLPVKTVIAVVTVLLIYLRARK
jgi:hypothetical protein